MSRIRRIFPLLVLVLFLTACSLPGSDANGSTPAPLETTPDLSFAYLASPDVQTTPPILFYYADGVSTALMQNVWNFAWSPDGKAIAAEVMYGGSLSDRAISLIDIQTSQSTLFAQGESLSWSPDGLQIAYEARTSDPAYIGAIFVTGLEQNNPTRKLVDLNRFGSNPTWSPDGNWIAYQDYAGSSYSLYILELASLTNRVIAEGLMDTVSSIAWSPDSTQLLFDALGSNNTDIYLADITAGTVINLTQDDPTYLDEGGVWSPDGTSILFVSFRVDDTPQVFSMNADGSNVVQLTDATGANPVWSPDGSRILYTLKDGSLYVMNADGSNKMPVPQVEPDAYTPQWRP